MGTIDEDLLPPPPKKAVATSTTGDELPLPPVKKKEASQPVSLSGLPQLGNGLNPFQSSQAPLLYKPEAPAPSTPVPQDYWKSLSPQEQGALSKGTQQSQQTHAGETLSATPTQQQGDYQYAQTLPGKIQNGLTYLAQKATKGGFQVAKGAAYLASMQQNATRGQFSGDDPLAEAALNKADKATDFLPKTSQNEVEKSKTISNLGGLAEFLPSAAAAEGTGGATLYLQGIGQGKEIMDKVGKDVNPVVKTAFILGTGAVNGFLMGEIGHGIYNSLGTSMKNDVVKSIAMDAIKEAAGKDLTAQEFGNLLKQGAKDWSDKALQTGVNFLESTKKAATDLTALNVGNFALKQGVNATTDQPVFNENLGTLSEQEGETLKSAPLFGLAGSASDLTKLTPFSEYKNSAVEGLIKDPSADNIARTKQIISDHGAEQGWAPEEIKATQDHIDQIGQVVQSIPKGIAPDKKEKAIDLIINRNKLQSELSDVQQQNGQLDPAFGGAGDQGQLLSDKIDQANDKLRDLATGKRTTYSKGTELDGTEGQFFKTVNGVKEEITPERYALEKLERESKVEGNATSTPTPVAPTEVTKEQEIGGTQDAIQEQGTGEVGVRQPSTMGEGVGGQDQSIEPTQQSQSENISGENAQPEEKINKREQKIPASEAPDVKELSRNMPEVGKPGISIEPSFEREYGTNKLTDKELDNGNKYIVSRDKEGKVNGALEISYNGENGLEREPTDVKVAVSPESRRQGIATALFKHAEENGIDLSKIRGTATTDEGQALYEANLKNTVSSKKASIRTQAEKVDVTLGDNKGGVRTKEIVESEADKKLKDGYDVHDLVDKIKNEKHVATDTENVILAKYVGAKTNEIVDLNKKIAEEGATMSDHDLQELTAKRDAALNDFQDVANANDQTRSDAGRALRSGQFKVNDNYSLENMIIRERELKGDKLTPDELNNVTKKYEALQKANNEYEKKLKESQEEISRLKADKAVRSSGPRTKAKTHEDFVAERKKIAEDFSAKLKRMRTSGQLNSIGSATAQFLQAAAPYVAKMVTSLAHEGITELGEVVKRIKEELDLNDLSDKDIHDMIGGKYINQVSRDEIQTKIARLRTEARLLSQIDDAENGKRKFNPTKQKEADVKIEGLRTRLKELNKENGLYDEKNAETSKKQIAKEIADLQGKIDRKEFDKVKKPEPLEEPKDVRELRRTRDALRHEYEVDVAKRELEKRSKVEKTKDALLNIASLPRAIKATLDFSAVFRQGLIPTISHPISAAKALKSMFGQTFSEKKYRDWFSDIKKSPVYDLMKSSGLYISEKNNPELLAREEQFTSNILEKLPLIGKIHQGAERAYTGYLNAIRTGVFTSEAQKLMERGYTFKNNPKVFQDLATVINTLSGRGNIPDWLGGKQPAVLSNLLFSPRFMASRIHTLYMAGDPRLGKSARLLAAKDIGKTLATMGTLLTMAKLSGYQVSTDPSGSDFLKLRDGDTRYDLFGGLGQYVVFLSQELSGQKTSAGATKPHSLTSGKFGAPNRLDNTVGFMRGKLNPIIGSATNLMAGKDITGQPYHLWPNVPQEFVPLPATDVYDAYKTGGITNALKVLVPSQFGIGVSSFKPYKKK